MTRADPRARLGLWLRSLWNIAPPLHLLPVADASVRGYLSPHGLHLPAGPPGGSGGNPGRWQHAAAAHGAAHLVYSNHRFAATGLRPVTQALLGLLEDARVEWLAARELPGLRRLWNEQHGASAGPGEGDPAPGFEALMTRLARCLLDPSHADPHPWVAKGRQLFYLDGDGRLLALRQPADLRRAASLLGNDIGQMRLHFNAPTYAVLPSYRDDNQWLWDRVPEALAPDPGAGAASAPAALPAGVERRHRYPEWDARIGRYRDDWCAVIESRGADAGAEPAHPAAEWCGFERAQQVPPRRPRRWCGRQFEGAELDLEALIREEVARRGGGTRGDGRVHRRRGGAAPVSRSALLLLDASASTARLLDRDDARGPSLLDLAREAALRCALEMARAGDACAIHAFRSEGREAVHYERLVDAAETLDAAALARLAGLRSRWSTRLGAALRHATALCAENPAGIRLLLLVTDGEPHDIDVHDPRYLVDDARQAVREARRRGLSLFCICIGGEPTALEQLRRIFGPADVRGLTDTDGLPRVLRAAAARAAV